jgi:S-DNA-T family DNA segregation ATPase FtsK/SpoIIIE
MRQAVRALAPIAAAAPTPSTPASGNNFSAPWSFVAAPATAASSSLDQRQVATAAAIAQPHASPITAFAPAAPAGAAPSSAPSPTAPLAQLAPNPPLSSLGTLSIPSSALLGSGLGSSVANSRDVAPAAAPASSHGGGTTPRTPTAPPCSSGAGASAPGGNAASGSSPALHVATLVCSAPQGLQPHRLTPTLWRQAAFVSLQERPG